MGILSIIHRFEPSSIIRLFKNANMVSKYSKTDLLYVLYDMCKTILNDGIGYMEYNIFHFIYKDKTQRNTYITFTDSQRLFKQLNDRSYYDIFNNKLIFNEVFKDLIGRDFIDAAHCSDEEFVKFCKGKDKIYCKPKDSCSGKGIYKLIQLNENSDLIQLHKFMIDNDLFCEDAIIQCKEMSHLNATSINTIRITTIFKDNKSYFMYACMRIGQKGMHIDNISAGGIYTLLDENGVVNNPFWSDKTLKTYTVHPTNDIELIGFKVPMFKQAVDICLKAAKRQPHMSYIGWDIAITDKGPIIVEGNQLPGYDMPQNCFVSNNEIGLKPKFERILGNIFD